MSYHYVTYGDKRHCHPDYRMSISPFEKMILVRNGAIAAYDIFLATVDKERFGKELVAAATKMINKGDNEINDEQQKQIQEFLNKPAELFDAYRLNTNCFFPPFDYGLERSINGRSQHEELMNRLGSVIWDYGSDYLRFVESLRNFLISVFNQSEDILNLLAEPKIHKNPQNGMDIIGGYVESNEKALKELKNKLPLLTINPDERDKLEKIFQRCEKLYQQIQDVVTGINSLSKRQKFFEFVKKQDGVHTLDGQMRAQETAIADVLTHQTNNAQNKKAIGTFKADLLKIEERFSSEMESANKEFSQNQTDLKARKRKIQTVRYHRTCTAAHRASESMVRDSPEQTRLKKIFSALSMLLLIPLFKLLLTGSLTFNKRSNTEYLLRNVTAPSLGGTKT